MISVNILEFVGFGLPSNLCSFLAEFQYDFVLFLFFGYDVKDAIINPNNNDHFR